MSRLTMMRYPFAQTNTPEAIDSKISGKALLTFLSLEHYTTKYQFVRSEALRLATLIAGTEIFE